MLAAGAINNTFVIHLWYIEPLDAQAMLPLLKQLMLLFLVGGSNVLPVVGTQSGRDGHINTYS